MTMPGTVYQVRPLDDGLHVIEKIDQSAFPPEMEPIPAPSAEGQAAEDISGDAVDTCDEIRVLVAYSPEARAAAGGKAAMESLIAQAVAEANQTYVNSGIVQRINLAYIMETSAGDAAKDFSQICTPCYLLRMEFSTTSMRRGRPTQPTWWR